MGNDGWEKVTTTKRVTRSSKAATKAAADTTATQPSKIPESVKARRPLREKNQQPNKTSTKNVVLKSLEECNTALGSVQDLQKEITNLYQRTPDRPNIWLNELVKNVVARLNLNEKNVPKTLYLSEEWLKLKPKMEELLAATLKDDSKKFIKSHTRSTLYHETLLSLVEDACKNRPTAGYKIFLQVLAKHYPTDCQKSISDRLYFHASQAHAYRSNPSTCMPLLWAMGLPFLNDPVTLTSQPSVDIFERAMVPVAENKPLNSFVVYYLGRIVTQSRSINNKKALLTASTLQQVIDLTFNGNFDKPDQESLKTYISEDLVIPAVAFENLLGLLDKNASSEFQSFVLGMVLKLLKSAHGEEACQLWNLNYWKGSENFLPK